MKEELILYMANKGYRYKKTADKIVLRKSKNHIYYTIEIGEYGISSYISRQNALTTKEVVEELNNIRPDYLFVNLSEHDLDLLLCALSGTDFKSAERNAEKENLTKRIIALKEEQESGKNDE